MNKSTKTSNPSPTKAQGNQFSWDRMSIFSVAVITLVSIFIWRPAINNSMVYWDDDRNFYENILVNSPTNSSLATDIGKIFNPSNHVIGNYNPLTISVFRIQNALFGMEESSWKYWHSTNILLHLFCILLAYIISRKLGLGNIGASIVALLFAIHPMRVESVAWLTELKDVMFGFFYLWAILIYINVKKDRATAQRIAFIIVLFILSCLSKIQAVSIPLSFLAIDFYFEKKWTWKDFMSKWYLFGISLFFGILGIYTLGLEGSLETDGGHFNFFQRIFIGAYSYCVYLIKVIAPYRLVPMYPYPSQIGWMHYVSIVPALLTIGLAILAYVKKWKVIGFGWLFFTVNIMFVLQVLGAGQGFMADRFSYIPYLGLFFCLGYYFEKAILGKKAWRVLSIAVVITYIGIMGYITTRQIPVWKNSETLWTHVINYYPNTKLPWGNRANFRRDQGQIKAALADYTKRLNLGSIDPKPFNSRGKLYFNSNNPDTLRLALSDYNKAIELAPNHSEYYVNRGSTKARLGDLHGSLDDYNKAEELEPNNHQVFFNRSIINHQIGNYLAEKEDIEKYLKYDPNHTGILVNYATANRLLGTPKKGLEFVNKSIKIKPSKAAFYERAKIYIVLGDLESARKDIATLQQNGVTIPQGMLNAANQ